MTVDLNKEQSFQGKEDFEMASTMQDVNPYFKTPFSPTQTATPTQHQQNQAIDSESKELSSRISKLQLRDKQNGGGDGFNNNNNNNSIPRRQPTIVCEDICDDIDIDDMNDENESSILSSSIYLEQEQTAAMQCIDQSNGTHNIVHKETLTRSASTASLTVPVQSIEIDDEKKRPPLPL